MRLVEGLWKGPSIEKGTFFLNGEGAFKYKEEKNPWEYFILVLGPSLGACST
jgi:hypothetical protein